jgi:uncharacterized membrane protein
MTKHRIGIALGLLVATAISGVVFAQSLTDPASWNLFWADAVALSGLVLLAVAVIKTRLPDLVSGAMGLLTSVVVGIVLGIAGIPLGYYAGGIGGAAGLGFAAAIIASGGYDLVIKQLVEWLKGALSSPPSS